MKAGLPWMFSTLLLFSVALPAAADAPPSRAELVATGSQPVADEDLKRLLPGNTLYHFDPATGMRVPIYYAPDGTRSARIRGTVVNGPYKVEGGKVVEYSAVLKRYVRRELFWVEKPKGMICEDDAPRCGPWFEWAEGNPEKLGG